MNDAIKCLEAIRCCTHNLIKLVSLDPSSSSTHIDSSDESSSDEETSSSDESSVDPEKKKKNLTAQAKGTSYYLACEQKASRLSQTNPWVKTRRRIAGSLLLVGWCLMASVIYQVSQFDYELANFDPYEILGVTYNTPAKEIKKKYREMSLIYHPDKPTGNEKLFMKLTKAYDALTDETAKYNWEHYGNPDGPQAMVFGIGLPAWLVEEHNAIYVLGLYTLVFMIGLPSAVYYWWSNSIKFSGEQVLLDTTQLYYCSSMSRISAV